MFDKSNVHVKNEFGVPSNLAGPTFAAHAAEQATPMTGAGSEDRLPSVPDAEVSPGRLRESVLRLARQYSIELTPHEALHVERTGDHVPAGTRVYITWLKNADLRATIRTANRLRRDGMTPVPHLAARAIRDRAQLDALLGELRGEADVRDVLVIGGAVVAPAGEFDCTLQMLETGLLEKHGITSIGVAGHPEGSPDIGEHALRTALIEKNAFAQRASCGLHVTTQFCFAAEPVVAWERAARQDGNRLGIHVGLAGLASIPTLIKHARYCGVGASIGVLLRQSTRMFRLASATTPGRIVLELARAKASDAESKLETIHYFPFGSFQATAAWANAVAKGSFDFTDEGNDLVVAV